MDQEQQKSGRYIVKTSTTFKQTLTFAVEAETVETALEALNSKRMAGTFHELDLVDVDLTPIGKGDEEAAKSLDLPKISSDAEKYQCRRAAPEMRDFLEIFCAGYEHAALQGYEFDLKAYFDQARELLDKIDGQRRKFIPYQSELDH